MKRKFFRKRSFFSYRRHPLYVVIRQIFYTLACFQLLRILFFPSTFDVILLISFFVIAILFSF